jgi:hypothetical protein
MMANGKLPAASVARSIMYLSVQGINYRLKRKIVSRNANTSMRRQDEETDDDNDRVDKNLKLEIKEYYQKLPLPPELKFIREKMDTEEHLTLNIDWLLKNN